MFAFALAVGVPQRRAAGADWWRGPDRRLDGVEPGAAVAVPIGGVMLAGAAAVPADLFTVSSASKRVIGPTGTLDTVAANALAHDWAAGRRRLQIEPRAVTKYGPGSEGIGGAGWSLSGVTVTTGFTGPDGAAGMSEIVEAGANTRNARLAIGGGAFSAGQPEVIVDTMTGAIVSKTAGATASVVAMAGGRWRIHLTVTTAAAGGVQGLVGLASGIAGRYAYATSGSPTAAAAGEFWAAQLVVEPGNGSTSIRAGYFNVEKVATIGESPSSYVRIPSTAAVTRIADDVRLSASALAQITGVGGCTIALRYSSSMAQGWVFGGAANGGLLTHEGVASVVWQSRSDAGPPVNVAMGSGSAATGAGVVITRDATTAAMSANGSGVARSSASSLWSLTDETAVRIGAAIGGGNPINLTIDEIVIWPRVGSDAALQSQARVYA